MTLILVLAWLLCGDDYLDRPIERVIAGAAGEDFRYQRQAADSATNPVWSCSRAPVAECCATGCL